MIAPAVRNQLVVTTLLFLAAAMFGSAALQLNRFADGWTTRSIWLVLVGLVAVAGAVGPWLWAQTVRHQRIMFGAILLGSGGGLIALLPGMSYAIVGGAQAALAALIIAERR